jgi:superfamily II DNA or RNA helicase
MDRDKLQAEAVKEIVKHKFQGIIDVSPRFGKSKVVIDALKQLKNNPPVLIIAPFNTILKSWEEEFEKWGFKADNITLSNQRSLEKHNLKDFKIIISDECHSLSPRQMGVLASYKGRLLGLSGSISKSTKHRLNSVLDLSTIYKFSLAKAVNKEIVADYEIFIITMPLNSKDKYIEAGSKKKKFMTTEKDNYDYLTKNLKRAFAIAKKDKSKQKWAELCAGQRARAIYSYKSKLELVKKFIATVNDRALVFTTLTKNDLVKHKHDSKSDGTNLQKFIDGKIDKLQVCNMVSMGVTIPDLKVGIFHQLQSNSEVALQKVLRMCNYEEGEKAKIFIFAYQSTNDEKWVQKAISMLDKNKITYVHHKEILSGKY